MRVSCAVHVRGRAGPASDAIERLVVECGDTEGMLDVIYRVHAYVPKGGNGVSRFRAS